MAGLSAQGYQTIQKDCRAYYMDYLPYTKEDEGDTDVSLQEYVLEALTLKVQGRSAKLYTNIVHEISILKQKGNLAEDSEHTLHLMSLLEGVTGCVSYLHEHAHEAVISEIITIPLWNCSEHLRAAVLRFMIHLVVVNGSLLMHCLQALVYSFQPPRIGASMAEDPNVLAEPWQPSELAVAVQDQVISALEQVMHLVPVSNRLLIPILVRGLPNKVHTRDTLCTYLRALLRVAELPRAVAIRDDILAAVVQHLISLDVEIRWQDISFSLDDEEEEEEEEGEDEDGDIFELEGQTEQLHLDPTKFADGANEEGMQRRGWEGTAVDQQNPASTSGRPEVDEMAEKLDGMMCLMFHHLQHRSKGPEQQRTWVAMLNTFFSTIINTHRSKFIQYLVWYLMDLGPAECSRSLVSKLLMVLQDPSMPEITRSASAAYIASFLARAAFVPESVLLAGLQGMADWCLGYCRRQDALAGMSSLPPLMTPIGGSSTAQSSKHQVFYAACQGLLYVLCYRLEQLMVSKTGGLSDGVRALFKDVLPALLHHRLAPMTMCLPTVVTEFTSLASRLDLMDCSNLMTGAASASSLRPQRPLEMFFPFDPYLLRRSAAFLDLRRTFVRWKQGHSEAAPKAEHEDAREEESEYEEDSESEASSDSDSSSSGLEAEDEEEEEEEEDEEEAEAGNEEEDAQSVPVTVTKLQSNGKRMRANAFDLGASYSSNGTSSPPCGMSWTPKLVTPSYIHQALLRPLDAQD